MNTCAALPGVRLGSEGRAPPRWRRGLRLLAITTCSTISITMAITVSIIIITIVIVITSMIIIRITTVNIVIIIINHHCD